jgi:hypothetical protein
MVLIVKEVMMQKTCLGSLWCEDTKFITYWEFIIFSIFKHNICNENKGVNIVYFLMVHT